MKSCDIISSKYLIDNMLNLEAKTTENLRLIHYACYYGSAEMIKMLINGGVNLNQKITKYMGTECDYGIFELIKLNKVIKVAV